MYRTWAFLGQFSPFRHETGEPRYILTKTSNVKLFEVKSVLESTCKRFRKSAMRENFTVKQDPQVKETLSNSRCNYIHQHNKYKRKLFSFNYVWTTCEHQVPEMYASPKIQFFFLDFETQ